MEDRNEEEDEHGHDDDEGVEVEIDDATTEGRNMWRDDDEWGAIKSVDD